MWKVIWMVLSTPVKAIFTGRYESHRVSRNPLEWLGMIGYGILLIPFTLFVYPIIILMTYFGLRQVALKGTNAEVLSSGLRLFSEEEGELGEHKWSEIDLAERRFSPPIMYPAVRLVGDKWIELQLADFREVLDACRSNGVRVNEEMKYM